MRDEAIETHDQLDFLQCLFDHTFLDQRGGSLLSQIQACECGIQSEVDMRAELTWKDKILEGLRAGRDWVDEENTGILEASLAGGTP